MGSAKAKEKGNRFSGSSYQDLKLPNKNGERFAGREMLAEVNRPSGLLRSQTPTKRDALAGVLRNSLPSAAPAPSWALASAQASQAPAARPQSQPTTKPAGSDGKGPKITYKPSKPSVPPMRSETQATVERALREAGITSIKISSTQKGSFTDKKRVHDIDSNHYNRPGKVGTSADISEIDGRPVSTYSTDPYVKQKVDAFSRHSTGREHTKILGRHELHVMVDRCLREPHRRKRKQNRSERATATIYI